MSTKTSRIWQFEQTGGPEVLQIGEQEISLENIPSGHAVIRILASGLNNSEMRYFQGKYAMKPLPGKKCFLGGEAVGEIVALGPETEGADILAQNFKVGDRVGFIPGSFEVLLCGTYRTLGVYPVKYLLPIPNEYSDSEGAAFWMAAITSIGALMASGLTHETAKGKRIVVTAASSGIATLALQIIKAWGGIPIAVTRSKEKADKIRKLNIAEFVILNEDPKQLEEQIKEVSEGKGFDVALDPTGGSHFEALATAAGLDSHIVVYEMIGGQQAQLNFGILLRKDLSLHGFTIISLHRRRDRLADIVKESLRIANLIKPVVYESFNFEELQKAFSMMADSKHVGKIVIVNQSD